MSWSLKGVAGALKNKIFPLKPGLTLGRQGDLVVPDTKASSIHARVIQDASGHLLITDNNSKNGTRIKGERVAEVPVKAGTVFYIGDQGFEIIQQGEDETPAPAPKTKAKSRPREKVPDLVELDELTPAPPARAAAPPPTPAVKAKRELPKLDPEETKAPIPVPEEGTLPPLPLEVEALVEKSPNIPPQDDLPEPPPAREDELEVVPEAPAPKPKRYWHEILAEFMATNQEDFQEKKKPVSALNPAVVLEFVRGLQVSTHWVLGYGPRKIGPNSLDLPIFEPGAPAVCFEIFPSADGIVFKTNHPELVLLNGQAVDSNTLRVGDVIRINETLIEVDFEE